MRKIMAPSLLALAMTVSVCGQTSISHADVPALKFKHQIRQRYSSWFVDYVQYDGEPAFRIRVHHYHKWCNGYLFLTPTRVAYVPQFTPSVNDSVAIARQDIVGTTPRYAGYEISIQNTTYAFAFLSDPDTAFAAGESDGRTDLLKFVSLALSDFAAAQRSFLTSIAGGDPGSTTPRFTMEPIIKVLNPVGAINNATVDASAPTQSVLGIAAAAGGIKAVTVNGAPANLIPLSPDIVQFKSADLFLKDANTVSIAATGGDNSVTQVAFNLIRPGVRITQPAVVGKIVDPAVTIRGLVIGIHNFERIDLAGKNLAVSKQPDGTFAFESASVPLNMGLNCIPGFLVRANGDRELFWATVLRVPPGPPPLSLDRIEGALRADVTNGRLINLVNENGVDFQLTPEIERHLRSLGATKTLIDAINNSLK